MKARQARKAGQQAAAAGCDRTSPGSSSPAAAASLRWAAVSPSVRWGSAAAVVVVAVVRRSSPVGGRAGG